MGDSSNDQAIRKNQNFKIRPKLQRLRQRQRKVHHNDNDNDGDNEYQYWLSTVKSNGWALWSAPHHIKNNKKIVISAVKESGHALKFASPHLQFDREVVLAASSPSNNQDGDPFKFLDLAVMAASPSNNKDGDHFKFLDLATSATEKFYYQYCLSRVEEDGMLLQYAPEYLRNNKNVVIAAVQKNGLALEYASPSLQNDKQVVLAAVQNDTTGWAIKFVAPAFKDKEVFLLAVKQNSDSIKYVHEDLKRDPDILIAACRFDGDHQDAVARRQSTNDTKKIVFSTRFSLQKSSHSGATNFTAGFKNSNFYQEGNFIVYAPNAFDKKTCDPEWTRFDWPCRGTANTCKYKNNLTPEGHPTDDCCWRYSFRSQLQEAKDTQGFMLQLVETEPSVEHGKVMDARLGMGQRIELDMANNIGTKVFQVYRPERYDGVERRFEARHIYVITNEISRWYSSRCQDMSVTIIRQPYYDHDDEDNDDSFF